MKKDFDIRKFLLDTFYDRKDVMMLSKKGMAFTEAMVEFESNLTETQKSQLEKVLDLQFVVHKEEMEKLVDWCVKILKK